MCDIQTKYKVCEHHSKCLDVVFPTQQCFTVAHHKLASQLADSGIVCHVLHCSEINNKVARTENGTTYDPLPAYSVTLYIVWK